MSETIGPETGTRKKTKFTYVISAIAIACLMIGTAFGMMISATTPSTPTVIEPGSMTSEYRFIIFYDNGIYYAKNGTTGSIDFSNTNVTSLMVQISGAMGIDGGIVYSAITNQAIDLRRTDVTGSTTGILLAGGGNHMNLYTRIGAGQINLFSLVMEAKANFQGLNDTITFNIDKHSATTDFGTLVCLYNIWTNTSYQYSAYHVGGRINPKSWATGNVWLTYPINFRNSCYINVTSGTADNVYFWTVWAKNLTMNTISTRMKAVTYASNALCTFGTSYEFLNIGNANGITNAVGDVRGRFLGINLVLHGLTSENYLENNPTILFDHQYILSSGTEDFFLSGWYYGLNPITGPFSGCTIKDTVNNVTCQYRDFTEQGGIAFQHGFDFWEPNNEGSTTFHASYWLIYEVY